jgi:CheY-like chemotaxis protein
MDFPGKITYADDDKAMLTLVRTAIEASRSGVLMVTCKSGQELVNNIQHIKPDLVLLDLQMADMNGPDTVMRLRGAKSTANIPVIFITGYEKVEMTDAYKKLGVIGVIHKPVDPDTIADQIQELWQARKG